MKILKSMIRKPSLSVTFMLLLQDKLNVDNFWNLMDLPFGIISLQDQTGIWREDKKKDQVNIALKALVIMDAFHVLFGIYLLKSHIDQ